MKFLMLVCREPEQSPTSPSQTDIDGAPEMDSWWQAARDAGQYVMGDRLRPADEAVTVRVRDGARVTVAGPCVAGGESIVGFDILECRDMDEAVEVVAGHPMAHLGAIELRAQWPFGTS